jgi:hypothetical protein
LIDQVGLLIGVKNNYILCSWLVYR